MTDQQDLWNRKHAAGEHSQWSDKPRSFAVEVALDLKPGIKLLELGCGVGSDARFFSQKGINVLATDFSDTVVRQNIERGVSSNLQFTVLDMADPFPYGNKAFDVVYAYLSLHYYSAGKTKEIFQEIARVLKPKGKLYFTCKSVHDHKYGEGEQIAPDIFIRNEHIRHFFSMEYTRQLVEQNFEIVSLKETSARYIEDKSSFIECWAVKKENRA